MEIADGAVLVGRAVGETELHRGCKEVTGHGDFPYQGATTEIDALSFVHE
jgi:hypothetical protein